MTDVFVPQPQSSQNHRAEIAGGNGSAAHSERTGEVPVVEATPAVPKLIGGSPPGAATLEARDACAWFGDHLALEGVFLTMEAGRVTALIGPSGCGKSTFLRLLNRMHELVPGSAMAGEILLDGDDIYGADMRAQVIRTRIGMVFQKPNPFPAMSIRENVLAGLKLTKIRCSDHDGLVEQSLQRAGLWREVRDRLGSPGARSPVGNSSGFASRGRWPLPRTCCSWTSPARLSIPRRRGASKRRSPNCART